MLDVYVVCLYLCACISVVSLVRVHIANHNTISDKRYDMQQQKSIVLYATTLCLLPACPHDMRHAPRAIYYMQFTMHVCTAVCIRICAERAHRVACKSFCAAEWVIKCDVINTSVRDV